MKVLTADHTFHSNQSQDPPWKEEEDPRKTRATMSIREIIVLEISQES